ncbi:GNAT family N-acetyltransferase [Curtobacterium sp. VKM Ac-2865]|uniref:GNAT family N-acetyltransferase n=1 Tax=Curtobacterium sp. VKM Ac-2865 TaxID=2783817 RepID=UPI00188D36F2|nr:GNAT family N-acetyltransferase [Curtobacterium sp. VKM Ac-2865]MBF4582734.1 GNAT family N-acetyltransferase [Curtobacterium sp. VKM Ac-2865]
MIESSVVVRAAIPDEDPACVDVWTAAVAARDGVPEDSAVRVRAEAKFQVPRVACLVASAGAAAVSVPAVSDEPSPPIDGFVLVTAPGTGRPTDPSDAAYLSLLAVRPDLQARGVGRALLVAAVDAAFAVGHPAVVLHALADNLPALRLYEAAGFRPTGVTFPHALTGRLTATYVVGMPYAPEP